MIATKQNPTPASNRRTRQTPLSFDTTANSAAPLIAGDHHWQWMEYANDEERSWLFRWPDTNSLERHLRFLDRVGEVYRPLPTRRHDQTSLVGTTEKLAPLSALDLQGASLPRIKSLFESLGRWLRNLHDVPAPSGFGDIGQENSFHTFNAFMAENFRILGIRLRALDSDVVRDQSVQVLAALRNELSAFHPHGRSAWTVGRLTPSRIAVSTEQFRVAGVLDFGAAALRPPEYDIASLRIHRIFGEHLAAERAFWSGYGAARTCDLKRRITYFERLIELEHLLDRPAHLPST